MLRIDSARFLRAVYRKEEFVRDGLPQVAFVGRSNVGKSSLLNRLLGRKGLAKISRTPGRTRSINYFLINDRFYFVDLPGYGYAKASHEERRQWAKLVDEYLKQSVVETRLVVLVDGKVGATPLDEEAVGYLAGLGLTMTVVATKIDRVSKGRRVATLSTVRSQLELPETVELIGISSQTGEGVKRLWTNLETHLTSSKTTA